jgi:hypothetical protein
LARCRHPTGIAPLTAASASTLRSAPAMKSIAHHTRRVLVPLVLFASICVTPAVTRAQLSSHGYFRVSEQGRGSELQLELSDTRGEGRGGSSTSFSVTPGELPGLSRSQLDGANGTKLHFTLTREAGVFTFDGDVHGGEGLGEYSFSPDAHFADALASRGYPRPSENEQVRLALGDVTLATVDELKKDGYRQPSLGELARMAFHGVDIDYIRDMRASGYALGDVPTLTRFRDHGVDPEYIAELKKSGYPDLAPEVLVRFRDHGVDGDYIQDLAAQGYDHESGDAVLRARDHGVTGSFIKGFREAGYGNLTLAELVRLHDHGVTANYARRMQKARGAMLSSEDLVYARDHGVER